MKKLLTLIALGGAVCAGLLTGCQKQEDSSAPATSAPDTSATNAPAMPATNTPATNAP